MRLDHNGKLIIVCTRNFAQIVVYLNGHRPRDVWPEVENVIKQAEENGREWIVTNQPPDAEIMRGCIKVA